MLSLFISFVVFSSRLRVKNCRRTLPQKNGGGRRGGRKEASVQCCQCVCLSAPPTPDAPPAQNAFRSPLADLLFFSDRAESEAKAEVVVTIARLVVAEFGSFLLRFRF